MTPRKPRKMPKNQRAYPKKPRLAEITPEEYAFLADPANQGRIDFPQVYGVPHKDSPIWADAAQLAKWRVLRNPPTSQAEPPAGEAA